MIVDLLVASACAGDRLAMLHITPIDENPCGCIQCKRIACGAGLEQVYPILVRLRFRCKVSLLRWTRCTSGSGERLRRAKITRMKLHTVTRVTLKIFTHTVTFSSHRFYKISVFI
jgi:hypothetical protein